MMGAPKTEAGRRTVPIGEVLGGHLRRHRLARPSLDPGALVFARGTLGGVCRRDSSHEPFSDEATGRRAKAAWREAGLEPLGLHEGRHSFASMLLAAGASMQKVSALMGHTSIRTTLDLYGHLTGDAGREAVCLLDAHIERSRPRKASSDVIGLRGLA